MKAIIITISLVVILIGGTVILARILPKTQPTAAERNNVTMVDGKQIITITARGGYSPRGTVAKANTPTIIKIVTKGTFDCSSALVIPSIGYQTNLPISGETLVEVYPQPAGTVLQGLCAMGMYNFVIQFN
ncbi:hypothetical protein A2810_01445 [candidate division Kazan bacterium RIFCSPHIGHO2_01_FULL_49_10]|uniref:EfeO-type cupredoxin-like domain-containing protein n=1 Tax=candidate division Kazan bacterium RIFCSPLOWO2_01_FULL_48_13 TaxID=1798539 RepID=A0A1F4PPQ9_UNCK3|nr:MAG: hypothetical protein A2810_01445 [candidate division Kazan bacterium RIFCSPHIGHO2_01_FULL_49_10]OGB85605.1 MAG: hypothetical protein A2994_01125 [candidate division Kazan bacterium RIFCSPLOWO2_01_FULL_48_13]